MDVESKKDESKSMIPPLMERKRRRRNVCLVILAFLFLIVILIIILAFTVFKGKPPVTTVNSVSLDNLNLSVDVARLRVLLNVTLDTSISIKNPNKVGMKYKSSTAVLKYRGEDVGEVPVPAGKIGAGETVLMNLTLTVMADRFLSNGNLYTDVLSGVVPMATYVRISGKVQIMFKIHVVSYSSCDFNIDIINKRLANQTCHYKTKL